MESENSPHVWVTYARYLAKCLDVGKSAAAMAFYPESILKQDEIGFSASLKVSNHVCPMIVCERFEKMCRSINCYQSCKSQNLSLGSLN